LYVVMTTLTVGEDAISDNSRSTRRVSSLSG
jgi:hypothetical protein